MPRKDLEGRLPIVYNGNSAEEWYTLYCQEALKNDRYIKALKDIVKHQELMGGELARLSTVRIIAQQALGNVND